MNTKHNRRAQETRERMKLALLALLERMDILDITVSLLCEAAKINRSTFYAHYDSIADLMDELVWETGKSLMEQFTAEKYDPKHPFSAEHLAVVLEHIKENQNFYRAYLAQPSAQKQLDGAFEQLFKQLVQPMMHRLSVDDTASGYYFAFFQAGFLAVLSRWLQNSCRESPEEILTCLRNMLSHSEFPI